MADVSGELAALSDLSVLFGDQDVNLDLFPPEAAEGEEESLLIELGGPAQHASQGLTDFPPGQASGAAECAGQDGVHGSRSGWHVTALTRAAERGFEKV